MKMHSFSVCLSLLLAVPNDLVSQYLFIDTRAALHIGCVKGQCNIREFYCSLYM